MITGQTRDVEAWKSTIDRDRFTYNVFSEADRRRTFVNWPKEFISTQELAHYGFYHYGGDKVKCAFCDVSISDWDESDTPLSEHRKHSPHCPFLNRRYTSNIPIDEERLNENLPSSSPDECSRNEFLPNIGEHYMYPDLVVAADRSKTFDGWPKSIRQKPQELVEAGFFYTGQGDMVMCFSCGLGLRDWDVEDTAIIEHAKYATECSYLNLVKGPDFIKRIQEEQKNNTSKTLKKSISYMGKEDNGNSSENACKICFEKVADILFSPCNHCASCGSCSVPLKTCPVCRKTIESKTKIFFS